MPGLRYARCVSEPEAIPREMSEDDLLAAIRRILSGGGPGLHLGPGDDAALVDLGGRLGVLTMDMLVEGVHFERSTISPRDLGYKAIAVNVSDVAAMGGSPRYALVGLALPRGIEAAWVVDAFGGMREAADEYALALAGGDLSAAESVVVSVAVTGEVARNGAVTWSGAQAGDRILVTGALGASAGGLRLAREQGESSREALTSGWGRALLATHFRPVARVGEGQTLAARGATAMIDISDGLAIDLTRLCRESGVAAVLRLADVPVAEGLEELSRVTEADPLDLALHGGEDYELLVTLPPAAVEDARRSLEERFGTPLTEIGEITEGEGVTAVDAAGVETPLVARGWDHFAP